MTTKYIDKKKVAIIGELNSTQTIVQEIFVDDKGNEIPHGENFTVQTAKLSDSPLSPWHDIGFKKAEAEYERDRKYWEKMIKEQEAVLKLKYDKLYHMTKSVQGMVSSLESEGAMAFIRVLDFLSGRINWVVINDYTMPIIIPFDQFQDKYMYTYDSTVDGVKLITLYGCRYDSGVRGLAFKLNDYGDGSGSSRSIFPFHEEHEAIEKAKELLYNKKSVGWKEIHQAKEWGLELDPQKVTAFMNSQKESVISNLAGYRLKIQELEEELKKYE